jgi:sulfite reductase (NADPH) hemoprotein beta-component
MGIRLAELFRREVRFHEIAAVLRPLFEVYRAERDADERFGDWAARRGISGLSDLPKVQVQAHIFAGHGVAPEERISA